MSGDSQTSVEARVLLPFAVLSLAWGGSFVGIEVAVEHAPPLLLAGLRYAVAAAVVVPYAVLTESRLLPRSRDSVKTASGTTTAAATAYRRPASNNGGARPTATSLPTKLRPHANDDTANGTSNRASTLD